MIKAILFDVGGTLIEPNPSVGHIYSTVAQKHGISLPADQLNLQFKQAWKKKKGSSEFIDKKWWRSLVSDVFQSNSPADFEGFFEELYATFAHPDVWQILPQVEETLRELRNRKLILAVASNWDSRLPQLLVELKLAPYFDQQFISYSLGVCKPQTEFFRHCLKALQLNADQVMHVGDDEENDYKAPRSVGIKSFLINRRGSPLKTGALENLNQVLEQI